MTQSTRAKNVQNSFVHKTKKPKFIGINFSLKSIQLVQHTAHFFNHFSFITYIQAKPYCYEWAEIVAVCLLITVKSYDGSYRIALTKFKRLLKLPSLLPI